MLHQPGSGDHVADIDRTSRTAEQSARNTVDLAELTERVADLERLLHTVYWSVRAGWMPSDVRDACDRTVARWATI